MFFSIYLLLSCASVARGVTLLGKGYTDVVVTLPTTLPDDAGRHFITKLEKLLTSASEDLFVATRQGVYFSEIKIVFPPSWTVNNLGVAVENVTTELSRRTTVQVTSSSSSNQDWIRTQQTGECGVTGEYIEIDADFLLGSKSTIKEEDASRLFVRNWAKYRYGVFDEIPLYGGGESYFVDKENCRVTGCYDVHPVDYPHSKHEENGVPKCKGPEDAENLLAEVKPKTSLLFTHNVKSIKSFCDSFHVTNAPTVHNILCREESVWKVIKKSEDFKAMKTNLPIKSTKPVFKYLQEGTSRIVFVLQQSYSNEASVSVVADIIEMSLQMLAEELLPNEVEVGVVNFTQGYSQTLVPLTKILDKKNLLSNIELDRKSANVSNIKSLCAICGLEEAWKMLENIKASDTVILVAESQTIFYLPWGVIKQKRESRLGIVALVTQQYEPEHFQFPRGREYQFASAYISESKITAWWSFMMALFFTLQSPQGYHTRISIVHSKVLTNPNQVHGVFSTETINPGVIKKLVIMACLAGISAQWELKVNGRQVTDSFKMYPCKIDTIVSDVSKEWTYETTSKGNIETFAIVAVVLEEPTKSTSRTLLSWMTNAQTVAPSIHCELKADDVASVTATLYDMEGKVQGKTELKPTANGIFKPNGMYSGRICTKTIPYGMYSMYVNAQIRRKGENMKMELVGQSGYLMTKENLIDASPGRINDLKVIAVDKSARKVTLSFTAPSWICGNGQFYKLKYSSDRSSFFANQDLELRELPLNQTTTPQSEGKREEILAQWDLNTDNVVYIAIQGVQDDERHTEISNVVQIQFEHSAIFTSSPATEVITLDEQDATNAEPDTNFTNSCEGNTNNQRELLIIASSTLTGFVILVLIVNTAVCFYIYKKHLVHYGDNNKHVTTHLSLKEELNDSIEGGFTNWASRDHRNSDLSSVVEDSRTTPNNQVYSAVNEYCGATCVIHESKRNQEATEEESNSSQIPETTYTESQSSAVHSVGQNANATNKQEESTRIFLDRRKPEQTIQEAIYAQSSKRKVLLTDSGQSVTQLDLGIV